MKRWHYILLIIVIAYVFGAFFVKVIDVSVNSGDKIAVISVEGYLGSDSFSSPVVDKEFVISSIKKVQDDNSYKGVVFLINSPGGTVVATKEIADAIKKLNKPKVAYIEEVGASGGYWVASASDKIVADPMSITGSIGVTGSFLEFSGLMEKYGITYQSFKAGEYKEAGSSYKEVSDKEASMLQGIVDDIYDYFVSEISKNRKMSKEEVIGFSNGRIYLGEKAKSLGLIDYIGDKELAIDLTKKMANVTDVKIIEMKKKAGLRDLLSKLSNDWFFNIGRGIGREAFQTKKEGLNIELT